VKRVLTVLVVALVLAAMVVIMAAPVFAAAPCPPQCQTNGGGNVPNGNANGIPTTNPGGHAAPGQQ
jgi:membrane-associated PAP2 superfamily phosphatase